MTKHLLLQILLVVLGTVLLIIPAFLKVTNNRRVTIAGNVTILFAIISLMVSILQHVFENEDEINDKTKKEKEYKEYIAYLSNLVIKADTSIRKLDSTLQKQLLIQARTSELLKYSELDAGKTKMLLFSAEKLLTQSKQVIEEQQSLSNSTNRLLEPLLPLRLVFTFKIPFSNSGARDLVDSMKSLKTKLEQLISLKKIPEAISLGNSNYGDIFWDSDGLCSIEFNGKEAYSHILKTFPYTSREHDLLLKKKFYVVILGKDSALTLNSSYPRLSFSTGIDFFVSSDEMADDVKSSIIINFRDQEIVVEDQIDKYDLDGSSTPFSMRDLNESFIEVHPFINDYEGQVQLSRAALRFGEQFKKGISIEFNQENIFKYNWLYKKIYFNGERALIRLRSCSYRPLSSTY